MNFWSIKLNLINSNWTQTKKADLVCYGYVEDDWLVDGLAFVDIGKANANNEPIGVSVTKQVAYWVSRIDNSGLIGSSKTRIRGGSGECSRTTTSRDRADPFRCVGNLHMT